MFWFNPALCLSLRWLRGIRLVLGVVCLVPLWPLAAASSTQPAAATNVSSSEQIIAQIRSRLQEAQVELGGMLAVESSPTNIPPGATAAEVLEYKLNLESTVRAYERQLDDLAQIEALKQRQRDLAETARSWTGFSEPRPYSVLLVDNLRDSVHSLAASIEAAETTRDIFEKLKVENRDDLAQSDARLRSLDEMAESAAGRTPTLDWQRRFELVRNRLLTAQAAVTERGWQKAIAELLEHRQRLEFVRRQLIVASQDVRFSPADLNLVLARVDQNRAQLETEYKASVAANETADRALDSARDELRQALSESAGQTAPAQSQGPRVSALQQLVAVRTVQAETAVHRLTLARQLLDFGLYERALWQARFNAFGARDPVTLRKAGSRLGNLQRFLQSLKLYYTHQLELTSRRISEEQESLQARPETQGSLALARERLDSFVERDKLFREGLRSTQKLERLVLRWSEALDQDVLALPLGGRVRDLFSEVSSFAGKLWNFVVFVAEDTMTVDGQLITGRRSITVSKIVKAILILGIGYSIASLFVWLLERVAIRRFKVEPHRANLVRRWTRVFLVLTLIIISLSWVKIPLTVFAFLGGAIAIGLGFGMQTLLKNFISGIIILFERPFRVGDVVEIGGQCGTLTTIGIGSSVLQIGDGAETLIPNSFLLENRLTNWTYSNCLSRSSISVIVAGDSDTRRVAQILAEAADHHPLVLKEPKPEVLFSGFEDNGFAFELRYWLDIRKSNSARVASDLRHTLASAFAGHGINISFPQRELHFDPKLPLRVQVAQAETGLASRTQRP